ALDRGVRKLVSFAHVASHAVEGEQVTFASRRKFAGDPTVGAVDARLVDGAPQPDQVAELIDDAMHEGQERMWRVLRRPSSFFGEPDRARKGVKREHRLDALLAQLAKDVAAMWDLARVESARRRLEARPLDR